MMDQRINSAVHDKVLREAAFQHSIIYSFNLLNSESTNVLILSSAFLARFFFLFICSTHDN